MSDEIAARVAALEDAQSRRELLAKMLVHDLNGPLSSITGTLEYLRAIAPGTDLATNAEIADCIRDMELASQILRRLIADIAAVERVDELPTPRRAAVDVVALVRSIADARAKHDSVKKLTLQFRAADGIAAVMTDRDLVERVFWILADNACRNAPVGSTVSVEVVAQASAIEIAFTDAGPVLPEAHIPHVFSRDYRAWAKAAGGRPGRGLSMPFVQLAAERLGGQVAVDAPTPTTTRFSVTLPLV